MGFDRLIEKIAEMQNPTVAGLDPKLDYVPASIKNACFAKYGKTLEGAAEALLAFNKAIIDSICDIVPAIKPQAAYYEMYGWQGVRALAATIAYAQEKGMFVITDGKRNDIGTTMEAYATAHLGTTDVDGEAVDAFGADALTVNGYLGTDGIKPLAQICADKDKGIFVLVKTSNPSSGELQDMKLENGATVYEQMGRMCPANTATPPWARSSARPTPGSSRKCVKRRRTPSSSCPATARRAAARRTRKTPLIRTVSARSSIPAAASCARGKSRV